MARLRVTMHIHPEALDVFRRMSEVSGLSLARTLGDWCASTADGAGVVTEMYEQAKGAPGKVMSDMHARAKQVQAWRNSQPQTDEELAASHGYGRPAQPARRRRARLPIRARSPRPVIRGDSKPRKNGEK